MLAQTNLSSPYIKLMRLDKPIGILLLLWPTLWGLWLAADGMPPIKILIIFISGIILMRSAGCVINDIADRKFDGFVSRTAMRPLARGEITLTQALMLFISLLLVAASLLLFLNWQCWLLAGCAVLITIIYPFTKRIFHAPQLVLGIAFAWGIPMAYMAVFHNIPAIAWCLFFIAALWPVIYDTFYAMADRNDDLKIGVRSTAILFGKYDSLIIGLLQVIWLILWLLFAKITHLQLSFYLSLIGVAGLGIYQQILIRSRQPEKCFQAFLNNNWVGLIIFLGLLLSLA